MNNWRIWFKGKEGYRYIECNALKKHVAADWFIRNFHTFEIVDIQGGDSIKGTPTLKKDNYKYIYLVSITTTTGCLGSVEIAADSEEEALHRAFINAKNSHIFGIVIPEIIDFAEILYINPDCPLCPDKDTEVKEDVAQECTAVKDSISNKKYSSPLEVITELAIQEGKLLEVKTSKGKACTCKLLLLDQKQGTILVEQDNVVKCIFLREVESLAIISKE